MALGFLRVALYTGLSQIGLRPEGARSFPMLPEDALSAARSILVKRSDQNVIKVLVDNPNDCKHTIKAFRTLGCKVKVENDGAVLVVTRPAD